EELRTLPRTADMATRIVMQLKHRRLMERAVRWILTTRRHGFDVDATAAEFDAGIHRLRAQLPTFFVGTHRNAAQARRRRYAEERQAPRPLATRCASLFEEFSLFSICSTAHQRHVDPHEVARVYFAVAGYLRLDGALRRIAALRRSDNWDAMSRAVLRDDLYAAVGDIADKMVCAGTDPSNVEQALRGGTGGDGLATLLPGALDRAREPDLPILLVAADAAKSFAASIDVTAPAAC